MQPYPRERLLIDLVEGGLKASAFKAIDELEILLGENYRQQFMTGMENSGFFVPKTLYEVLTLAQDNCNPTLWGRPLVPWGREFILAVCDVSRPALPLVALQQALLDAEAT